MQYSIRWLEAAELLTLVVRRMRKCKRSRRFFSVRGLRPGETDQQFGQLRPFLFLQEMSRAFDRRVRLAARAGHVFLPRPVITEMEDPPEDSDEWREVKDKLQYLER